MAVVLWRLRAQRTDQREHAGRGIADCGLRIADSIAELVLNGTIVDGKAAAGEHEPGPRMGTPIRNPQSTIRNVS